MWETVNCTSSSPLKIYVTHAFMNSLIFFLLFFHPSFRFLFLYPHLFIFYLFLGSGISPINQHFMQEEISSRLNFGDAYSHSAFFLIFSIRT
jgi:hypothetical protein